jgi:hypothetical protein
MKRHVFTLAALVCFGGSVAARDPLPSAEIPNPFGVNIHFTRGSAGEADLIARAGFRIVRMDFAWGGIERPVGSYDFSAYDELAKDMGARGIRLLLILDYGHPVHTKGLGPATDADRKAFVDFARAGARHFKGRAILWEVWNEPNLAQFWRPQPHVENYTALAIATAKAIHEEDPEALVLAPATSRVDIEFLEGCFRRGLLDAIDVVSVHPYRSTAPETAESEVMKLRSLIARYAPAGKDIPIVNGEWGFSDVRVPIETQADYVVRQALFSLKMGLGLNIWYDWKNDGTDPTEAEHHFGTVFPDLKPKPAFIALQTMTETLQGFRFVKRLPAAPEVAALLFARAAEERVAVWSLDRERTMSLPIGKATLVDRSGNRRAADSCAGLAVGPSPLYVIPEMRSEDLALERLIVPEKRWIPVRAGEAFNIHVRLVNPLDRAIEVQPRCAALPELAIESGPDESIALAPAAGRDLAWRCTINNRNEHVRTVAIVAAIAGKSLRVQDDIALLITEAQSK